MLLEVLIALVFASLAAMWYFTGKRTFKNDGNPGSALGGLLVFAAGLLLGFLFDWWGTTSDYLQYSLASDDGGLKFGTWALIASLIWVLFNMSWAWVETGQVAA